MSPTTPPQSTYAYVIIGLINVKGIFLEPNTSYPDNRSDNSDNQTVFPESSSGTSPASTPPSSSLPTHTDQTNVAVAAGPLTSSPETESAVKLIRAVGRWAFGLGILLVVFDIFAVSVLMVAALHNTAAGSTHNLKTLVLVLTAVNIVLLTFLILQGNKLRKIQPPDLPNARPLIRRLQIILVIIGGLSLVGVNKSGLFALLFLLDTLRVQRKLRKAGV